MSEQNSLLLKNLLKFYKNENGNDHDNNKNHNNLDIMLSIINGESNISLRIIDWFVTNYSKKYFTLYTLANISRFKVYIDYKLKLKAYSKKRFDPFCRWDRIIIPYKNNNSIQTTIGQLNFFKWAIENEVIDYIKLHYKEIEYDMNQRNTNSKKKLLNKKIVNNTRKKREELSISASKNIYKEDVEIIINFS
jgi:hypothetical protein